MFLLIFIIVVALFIGFWFIKEYGKPAIGDCVGFLFVSCLFGTLLYALISFGICGIFGKYEKIEDIKLISMTNTAGIEGDFFLGCGTIKDVRYYMFRYQLEDGAIYEGQSATWCSAIYESDVPPHRELYKKLVPTKWTYANNLNTDIIVKYYVPKGTVIKEFSIK